MDYPFEIKTNVEQSAIDDALRILGLKDSDAESRAIYFCDSIGEPSLDDLNVVLRIRRDEDEADSTLKFRPFVAARLAPSWQAADGGTDDGTEWEYRVEQDWSTATDDPVLSASLVTQLDVDAADQGLNSGDVSTLFSTRQRDLFETYTGQSLVADQLRLLGPVRARKWKFDLGDRRVACEEWVVADTSLRFLELSDREDDPSQAEETRKHLLALYREADVTISSAPETKTKIVMDHFRSAQ